MSVNNQDKANECGVIETALRAMRIHIRDFVVYASGCTFLWNVSEGNCPVQKKICEKNGIELILEILRRHDYDKEVVQCCCTTIAVILSSHETHSKSCTPDVLHAVEECKKKYVDDIKINLAYASLMRDSDSRVRDAVLKGICTKKAFPKCEDDCGSDEGFFCPKCCVQQKAFRCRTCNGNEFKFCCETCWKKNHQGHECEEFFYPVRCF